MAVCASSPPVHERVEGRGRGVAEPLADREADDVEGRQAGHAGHGDLDVLGAGEAGRADRGAVVEQLDLGGGGAAGADAGQVLVRRAPRVVLRVREGAGQRRGADGVAGGGADLPGQVEPLAAGADQEQEQDEGGRGDDELHGHRAAVACPSWCPPVESQPHVIPWLAWVRKHSTGPLTVSLMVSGQMPVSFPVTVTETVLPGPAAACAVTPEIRLVSR